MKTMYQFICPVCKEEQNKPVGPNSKKPIYCGRPCFWADKERLHRKDPDISKLMAAWRRHSKLSEDLN